MHEVTFLVAGSLDARSGGSIYNCRMVEALRARGWTVVVHELDASFPYPSDRALTHAAQILRTIPGGSRVIADGLAFGAMPDVVTAHAARLHLIALIHLPLAAEVGLTTETAERLAVSERRALTSARHVIVTGPTAVTLMREYGLPHAHISVVPPGTDAAPLSRGSRSEVVELLAVAAVTPGKGYDVLIDALAHVPRSDWHLTCAGSLERSTDTVATVRNAATRHGLNARIDWAGELDDAAVATLFDRADVMVSASRRETYGMAVAEALARGVPVVATATGAATELLADDAGMVVPVGDVHALASALTTIVGDASVRARVTAGARRMRERLRTWDAAAAELAAILES
jgi:glycosyltransferase involved in cell wall biosynthesis